MFVSKMLTKGSRRLLMMSDEESESNQGQKRVYSRSPCATGQSRSTSKDLPPEVEKVVDEYVEHIISKGLDGLKQEYKNLLDPSKNPLQKTDAFRENAQRNRYPDIVCWDATRVQLTHDVPPATDYIHANWVKFDNFDRVYILTQAPLQNTIGDFWRMVLQCQSPSIVNLTQEVENENQKCVLYWPQHAGSFNSYGKVFVSTKRVEHQENFVIYTIEVLPEGCSNSHIVKLIHMPNWPAKGMPPSGRHVLRLLRRIVENKNELGPIIVHCSAGIGRSACIVMIDVILRYLFSGERVEMEQLLTKLRAQRANAIPTDSLYAFVAYSVIDYIRAKAPSTYKEKTQKFIDEFKSQGMRPTT